MYNLYFVDTFTITTTKIYSYSKPISTQNRHFRMKWFIVAHKFNIKCQPKPFKQLTHPKHRPTAKSWSLLHQATHPIVASYSLFSTAFDTRQHGSCAGTRWTSYDVQVSIFVYLHNAGKNETAKFARTVLFLIVLFLLFLWESYTKTNVH